MAVLANMPGVCTAYCGRQTGRLSNALLVQFSIQEGSSFLAEFYVSTQFLGEIVEPHASSAGSNIYIDIR